MQVAEDQVLIEYSRGSFLLTSVRKTFYFLKMEKSCLLCFLLYHHHCLHHHHHCLHHRCHCHHHRRHWPVFISHAELLASPLKLIIPPPQWPLFQSGDSPSPTCSGHLLVIFDSCLFLSLHISSIRISYEFCFENASIICPFLSPDSPYPLQATVVSHLDDRSSLLAVSLLPPWLCSLKKANLKL